MDANVALRRCVRTLWTRSRTPHPQLQPPANENVARDYWVPIARNSWGLAKWALPIVVAGTAVALFAPRVTLRELFGMRAGEADVEYQRRFMEDFNSRQAQAGAAAAASAPGRPAPASDRPALR